MSVSIVINSGEDEPFAVKIERFPTKIALDKPDTNYSVIFVGLFLLVFMIFVLNGVFPTLVWPVALGLGGALAVLALVMFRRSGRQNILLFEKTRVVVTESGLLKNKHWEADYTEFEGVLLRRRQARSGKTQSTYQVIELKHPDEKKTLPLFVDMTKKLPKERWLHYGELFDLPVIRAGE